MNILIVSNKAVFEGCLLASYYLEQEPDPNMFGNLALEKRKEALWAGADRKGNQVYILGTSVPNQVAKVYDGLAELDNGRGTPVWVVPVNPGWSWLTVVLAKLAALPLVGKGFNSLAGTWAKSHQNQLKQISKNLEPPKFERQAAAKPLR
ncbi:MAG: hypothetical protein ACM3NT_09385 [Methylocystaceae bacterium]